MARYDRIALLPPPGRESAFACWPVIRDLEGNDRDPELARRVRLRFLALRPVRRLLDRSPGAVSRASYQRQIEGVREELGQLPARDPERLNLSRYLERIREREPAGLLAATLELAEKLEAAAQPHGAEEYARTGLELAAAEAHAPQRLAALLLLSRLARGGGRVDEARALASAAADLALELGEPLQWALATEAVARAHDLEGDAEAARRVLTRILERGQAWGDDRVAALAARELCLAELAGGSPERAVVHGWQALRLAPASPDRDRLLDQLGTAFTSLGLYAAADRCYQLIANVSRDAVARVHAIAAQAAVAAEAGRSEAYQERRERVLAELAAIEDAPAALALIQVELARGALRLGATDAARDHARTAIRLAQAHALEEVLDRASGLLTLLEAAVSGGPEPPRAARAQPGPEARRIAAEVEALDHALAPASR